MKQLLIYSLSWAVLETYIPWWKRQCWGIGVARQRGFFSFNIFEKSLCDVAFFSPAFKILDDHSVSKYLFVRQSSSMVRSSYLHSVADRRRKRLTSRETACWLRAIGFRLLYLFPRQQWNIAKMLLLPFDISLNLNTTVIAEFFFTPEGKVVVC